MLGQWWEIVEIAPSTLMVVVVVASVVKVMWLLSRTKHIWYSEHGTYYRFEFILERAMSATHVAVIPRMRTHSDEEEFLKK